MRSRNMHCGTALGCVTFTIIGLAPPLPAQSTTAREPIARIGQEAIYEDDLLSSVGGSLWQLKNQEYEIRNKALATLVNQRLLEIEAARRGVSVEALLEQMVDRALSPVTAGEIEAYYLAQKDRINRPLKDVKPQLEQALVQAKRQQARQSYVDTLKDTIGVTILLARPRAQVAVDPLRLRGNPDAPVTIVEFSDFQCPYCQSAQTVLKQVLDKYPGKVRLAFRDFPLRQIHPQAQLAAEASRCAAEQGKFWEYHDLLFANASKLEASSLAAHAGSAKLDVNAFSACVASSRFKAAVEADLQAGLSAGVAGTPAFFINGTLLSGSQPLSAFESIIQSELDSQKSSR